MKNFYQQKSNTHHFLKRGFTLVETLVAISIFTFSLLTLMVVLGNSIANTDYAKAKNTSAYLAQEGIEDIRNMRDTFAVNDTGGAAQGWADFTSKLTAGGCFASNGCYFNADTLFSLPQPMPITQISFTSCGSSCTPLLYSSSSGSYNYTSGTNSGFTRKISVTQINANEFKVASTVSWVQGKSSYSITFYDELFNWIQ